MSNQQQLALLQNAMKTHAQNELIAQEDARIKERIAIQQDTLNRLQKLSLASASLLSSVDSTAPETEISSLKCLAKLAQSTAVTPETDKEDEDQVKLIVGKYLNRILASMVDFIEHKQGPLNILSMLELEDKIGQLFAFAEENEIIPETKEGKKDSWKTYRAQHQQLRTKITELLQKQGGPVPEEKQEE